MKIEELQKIFYHTLVSKESVAFWNSQYKKREKAMEKFGYIAVDYENIKNKGNNTNNLDLSTYGYWCRSIIGSGYSLEHPSYPEYREAYINRDKSWLPEGWTYVDLKKYKQDDIYYKIKDWKDIPIKIEDKQ